MSYRAVDKRQTVERTSRQRGLLRQSAAEECHWVIARPPARGMMRLRVGVGTRIDVASGRSRTDTGRYKCKQDACKPAHCTDHVNTQTSRRTASHTRQRPESIRNSGAPPTRHCSQSFAAPYPPPYAMPQLTTFTCEWFHNGAVQSQVYFVLVTREKLRRGVQLLPPTTTSKYLFINLVLISLHGRHVTCLKFPTHSRWADYIPPSAPLGHPLATMT